MAINCAFHLIFFFTSWLSTEPCVSYSMLSVYFSLIHCFSSVCVCYSYYFDGVCWNICYVRCFYSLVHGHKARRKRNRRKRLNLIMENWNYKLAHIKWTLCVGENSAIWWRYRDRDKIKPENSHPTMFGMCIAYEK